MREWLVATQNVYGGYVHEVPCAKNVHLPKYLINKIVKAGKLNAAIKNPTCTGGDRFGMPHLYDICYAVGFKWARRVWKSRSPSSISIAEVGILKGSGLALWSELFPKSNL